jgi:carbohydrate kinase (thermoresistant glucokinase family)
MTAAPILVVMGVSGAGKTTVGELIAERLGWPFVDGDDLHPQANIDKMRSGVPLTDADRGPWLAAIGDWIDARAKVAQPGVVACSALKRAYRDRLRDGRPQVRIVYLRGAQPEIAERLAHRAGHFWPAKLLASQFADLEEPGPDENPIVVDIGATPEAVAKAVIGRLS